METYYDDHRKPAMKICKITETTTEITIIHHTTRTIEISNILMPEVLSKDNLHCIVCNTELSWEQLTKNQKNIFHASGKTRIYCSRECSKEYCRRISSITMAKTNRKYASERMKKNNPSSRADVKAKISASRRGKPFPAERGGNGRGMTVPQMMLMKALSPHQPEAEYVVKTTGILKYPPAYKVDVALPSRMIAVEVDGNSHHSLKVKEADERKTSVLEQRGWKVLRFTNQQILENLDACVEKILSTT